MPSTSPPLFASVLVDGTLVNVALLGGSEHRLLLPPLQAPSTTSRADDIAAAAVHHCVFMAPCRATLRVTGAAMVLTATAGEPACGTFSLPAGSNAASLIVECCPEPLSFFERAVADAIAARALGASAAAHEETATPLQQALKKTKKAAAAAAMATTTTTQAAARNRAVHASEAASGTASAAVLPLVANWCPRLAAFRDGAGEQMCVVRRQPSRSKSSSSSSSARSAASASSNSNNSNNSKSKAAPSPLEQGEDEDASQNAGRKKLSSGAVRAVFGARVRREQRQSAVSFSSVMRFLQRERGTFRWASGGGGFGSSGGETVAWAV